MKEVYYRINTVFKAGKQKTQVFECYKNKEDREVCDLIFEGEICDLNKLVKCIESIANTIKDACNSDSR